MKQKDIKDLKEADLQKLFDEAEKMYKYFSKQRNDILTSDFERLKKTEQEYPNDTFWIKETKRAIEDNQKVLSDVKEVRENIIRLIEREAHTPIENRFQNYRDWYVYMHTFLYWKTSKMVRNSTTSDRIDRWSDVDDTEKAKDITLEEIVRRLKAKLDQTK